MSPAFDVAGDLAHRAERVLETMLVQATLPETPGSSCSKRQPFGLVCVVLVPGLTDACKCRGRRFDVTAACGPGSAGHGRRYSEQPGQRRIEHSFPSELSTTIVAVAHRLPMKVDLDDQLWSRLREVRGLHLLARKAPGNGRLRGPPSPRHRLSAGDSTGIACRTASSPIPHGLWPARRSHAAAVVADLAAVPMATILHAADEASARPGWRPGPWCCWPRSLALQLFKPTGTSPGLRHVQDRDGVALDGGLTPAATPKLTKALARLGTWTLEIVKRSDTAKGFVLLPRRWVVERTFAWFGRNRRLAKDFEKTIESAEAWLLIASIQLLTRRIARA